ncbi:transglycosylase SLT domain-containing protein [Streptomyces sp. NPDC060194]|uniref:transglycosylase SLT domain-containing protein n=1 Tax=Streptomyces sp. NPDC060194 TaxID=3347069 RepID=UPI00365E4D4A
MPRAGASVLGATILVTGGLSSTAMAATGHESGKSAATVAVAPSKDHSADLKNAQAVIAAKLNKDPNDAKIEAAVKKAAEKKAAAAKAEKAEAKKAAAKKAKAKKAKAKKDAAKRADDKKADRSKRTAKATPAKAPAKKTYANNLDGWIREAMDIMKKEGIPGSYEGIHRNIMRESSGNPRAINNWDINARNGIPSKGLLQVIQPTFDTYHVDGTKYDLYDPVANIVAACNYAADRYGSMDNVNSAY